jgi:hypothetical protein
MKDDKGNLITVREEVTKEFKKVFEKILNVSEKNDDDVTSVDQYLEEPSLEEVEMAVGMFKRG